MWLNLTDEIAAEFTEAFDLALLEDGYRLLFTDRRSSMREYYKANKTKVNASTKAWKAKNPEKHKAHGKQYRATHKAQIAARNRRNYLARKARNAKRPIQTEAKTGT